MADELEELNAKYEDLQGYRAIVHDTTTVTIVVAQETLGDWETSLAASGLRVAVSCVPSGLLEAAQEAAKGLTPEEGGFSSVGYDVFADAVAFHSTFPEAVVESALERVFPGASGLARSQGDNPPLIRISYSEQGLFVRQGRFDDLPPFYGGARTWTALPTGYDGCSTGFYLDSATNGTVMLTAGHCADTNGRTVWNGNWVSQVGTIEGRHFPNPDLALIDGRQYDTFSYAWSNTGTYKLTSPGSQNPITGVTYCQMGASSYRKCYKYDQISVQYCQGGCTQNLALSVEPYGPLSVDGDSGAGVYKELSNGELDARGMVVAGGCDQYECREWDHKLQTILDTFDATVVVN